MCGVTRRTHLAVLLASSSCRLAHIVSKLPIVALEVLGCSLIGLGTLLWTGLLDERPNLLDELIEGPVCGSWRVTRRELPCQNVIGRLGWDRRDRLPLTVVAHRDPC